MSPAVVILSFDPIVRIGGFAMRAEALGIALVVVAAILLAARIALVDRADSELAGLPFRPGTADDLRLDDLLFLALGAVPGAVIAGRIGYVLAHAEYFAANPSAIVDPAIGSLSLGLAVPGGLATAALVGRMLEAPVRVWAHVVTLPVLFALAAGKFVLLLGGTGQGQPSDLPWAVAYAGAGPWGSLAADVPSHPAQVYESLVVLVVIVVVAVALELGAFARRDGSALLAGVALWAVGRALVAATWRDPSVAGPLGAEQLMALLVVVVCLVGIAALRRRPRPGEEPTRPLREGQAARAARRGGGVPDWPDPESRPPF